MAEKPEQFIPVLTDMDLKIELNNDNDKDITILYTLEEVEMVIKIYQNVLINFY